MTFIDFGRKVFSALMVLLAVFLVGVNVAPSVALAHGERGFDLVTDLDDTLIETNNLSYVGLVRRMIQGRKTFVGMAPLIAGLAKNAEQVFYLSGAPQSLEGRLKTLLSNEGFPAGRYFLSNWFNWEPSSAFKTRTLTEMAGRLGPVLLFGDDAERDPEVLLEFKTKHPQVNVLEIYIHRVSQRPLPQGVVSYTTALEVALHEFEADRIDEKVVLEVAQNIEQKSDRILPDFVPCPESSVGTLGPRAAEIAELKKAAAKVFHLLMRACEMRHASPEAIELSDF